MIFFPDHVALLTPPFRVQNNATDTGKVLSKDDLGSLDEVTDEALNQLLTALNTDPDGNKDIGSFYAEKLCKAGKITALAKLLQVLRENEINLSRNVYSSILSAAGDANDVNLLSQVLKDMLGSDLLDSTLCVSTTKSLMKINDSLSLVKFVQDLSDLRPTLGVTFLNRTIYSLAGCGQVEKALLIFRTMKKNMACKPDLVSYNTVLGILGRCGRVDEMLVEFSCMKKSCIAPDLISFNTLINSLKKVGRLDLCLRFVKDMTEGGHEPDLRTYTSLIESFGRLGNVEESVRLFEEMKLRGVHPSIYVYRSLIDNLKKSGKVEVASKYLEEMKSKYEYLVGPKDFKGNGR